jgi:hypothetical protein
MRLSASLSVPPRSLLLCPIANMAYNGFTEPSFTELVSTLVDESGFKPWATSLKWALDSRDIRFHQLLTGSYVKPEPVNPAQPTPEEIEARNEWYKVNRYLLPLLNVTIYPNIRWYILDASDARSAYESLERAFAPRSTYTGFVKYANLMEMRYKSEEPQQFAKEWHQALDELQASGSMKIPGLVVLYQFLTAVSVDPGVRSWVNKVCLDSKDSPEIDLESILQDFAVSEDCRLATLHQAPFSNVKPPTWAETRPYNSAWDRPSVSNAPKQARSLARSDPFNYSHCDLSGEDKPAHTDHQDASSSWGQPPLFVPPSYLTRQRKEHNGEESYRANTIEETNTQSESSHWGHLVGSNTPKPRWSAVVESWDCRFGEQAVEPTNNQHEMPPLNQPTQFTTPRHTRHRRKKHNREHPSNTYSPQQANPRGEQDAMEYFPHAYEFQQAHFKGEQC